MIGYKVFTYGHCSPIQGGHPVWNGSLPFTLPYVDVDKSYVECGTGWNFCGTPEDALRIAGLWPTSWPSKLYKVDDHGLAIKRGWKYRAATLKIIEQVTDIRPIIHRMSAGFGELQNEIAKQQYLWYDALGRPNRDEQSVARGLEQALKARGLSGWKIKKFENAKAVRDARDASIIIDTRDALNAKNAWVTDPTWVANVTWATNTTMAARATWASRVVIDASSPEATWAAIDATGARDARDGNALFFAAKKRFVDCDPLFLAVGIRDAYWNGLDLAIPVGNNTLGWAMAKASQ